MVLLALLAMGCGGSDEDAIGGDSHADSGHSMGEGSLFVAENAAGGGSLLNSYDPAVARAGELSVMLVEQLGDDDTAAGSVMLAGDAGYDAMQIEAAIVDAALASDGSVAGIGPAFEPYDLIDSMHAKMITDIDHGDADTVADHMDHNADSDDMDHDTDSDDMDRDADLTPIEMFRRGAAEHAGLEDHLPEGASATAFILALQLSGYSQAQIVDVLVFGAQVVDATYGGALDAGHEVCPSYVIGGTQQSATFCDAETGELFPDRDDSGDASAAPAGGTCNLPSDLDLPLDVEFPSPLAFGKGPDDSWQGWLSLTDGGFTISIVQDWYIGGITVGAQPDRQHYTQSWDISGAWDEGAATGSGSGTHTYVVKLWTDDPNPLDLTDDARAPVVELMADGTISMALEADSATTAFVATATVPCR